MLRRLLYLVVYIIIAFIVGYVLTIVVDAIPLIPEPLKAALNLVIWAIVAICMLLWVVRMFADVLPDFGPPKS